MATLFYLGFMFNDINFMSGKYIWLEGGVRHKQLVLLKSCVKFLVIVKLLVLLLLRAVYDLKFSHRLFSFGEQYTFD